MVQSLKRRSIGRGITGSIPDEYSEEEIERKYQRALQIIERLAVMGCSSQDNLPYFKAKDVI